MEHAPPSEIADQGLRQRWYSLDEWVSFWRSLEAGDVIWATRGLLEAFRVTALGTTIIIDRQGHV